MNLTSTGVFEIAHRPYQLFIDSVAYSVNSAHDSRISFSGLILNCHKPFKVSATIPGNFKSAAPTIKNVVFNDPATVVMWSDGTKTVVKCQPGDDYSKETGLALCIAKKFLGNKSNFNDIFKQWIPEEAKTGLINVRSYNGFKIGDRVRVTYSGHHYSTYGDWVLLNVKNPRDREKWYRYSDPFRHLHDGDVGVIKAIAHHELDSAEWLAYVEIDGNCFIVNLKGLSKI